MKNSHYAAMLRHAIYADIRHELRIGRQKRCTPLRHYGQRYAAPFTLRTLWRYQITLLHITWLRLIRYANIRRYYYYG